MTPCRTACRARPTTSSSSAPGSPGWPPRCTCSAPAAGSPSLERADHPGGRAGRLDLHTERGDYRVDTGPTVLTMPDLLDEAFAAVGEKPADRLDLVELDPAYRAHFADGSHDRRAHRRRRRWRPRSGAVCGPRRPRRATGSCGEWLTELYRAEIDTFIGANFDSPLDLLGPRPRRGWPRSAASAGSARGWPRFLPDERLQRIFSFQALYAGVPPDRALAAYGVIAYMDTVARGVLPARRHAAGRARRWPTPATAAGAEIHYGRHGDRPGAPRRPGHRGAAPRDRRPGRSRPSGSPCDAVVLTARPAGGPPSCSAARPRRPVPAAVLPQRRGAARRAAHAPRPEAAHHTISFGAAWERTFREIITDGRLMSDPSLLITRPTATDPGSPPPGATCCSCSPRARTPDRGAARLGAGRARATATSCSPCSSRRGHPGLGDLAGDVEVCTAGHPGRLGGRTGMAAGHPVLAPRTRSPRPARSGRATWCAGWTNVVLAGCGTTPGVGHPAGADLRAARRRSGSRGPSERPGAGAQGTHSRLTRRMASMDRVMELTTIGRPAGDARTRPPAPDPAPSERAAAPDRPAVRAAASARPPRGPLLLGLLASLMMVVGGVRRRRGAGPRPAADELRARLLALRPRPRARRAR